MVEYERNLLTVMTCRYARRVVALKDINVGECTSSVFVGDRVDVRTGI